MKRTTSQVTLCVAATFATLVAVLPTAEAQLGCGVVDDESEGFSNLYCNYQTNGECNEGDDWTEIPDTRLSIRLCSGRVEIGSFRVPVLGDEQIFPDGIIFDVDGSCIMEDRDRRIMHDPTPYPGSEEDYYRHEKEEGVPIGGDGNKNTFESEAYCAKPGGAGVEEEWNNCEGFRVYRQAPTGYKSGLVQACNETDTDCSYISAGESLWIVKSEEC